MKVLKENYLYRDQDGCIMKTILKGDHLCVVNFQFIKHLLRKSKIYKLSVVRKAYCKYYAHVVLKYPYKENDKADRTLIIKTRNWGLKDTLKYINNLKPLSKLQQEIYK